MAGAEGWRGVFQQPVSEVRKRRPLNPLLAIIAAEEKWVAQREAEVEARIQAAVKEAIKKERALTN